LKRTGLPRPKLGAEGQEKPQINSQMSNPVKKMKDGKVVTRKPSNTRPIGNETAVQHNNTKKHKKKKNPHQDQKKKKKQPLPRTTCM